MSSGVRGRQGTTGAVPPPNPTVLLPWPLLKGWGSLWLKDIGLPYQWEMGRECTLGINRTSHSSPSASTQEACSLLAALSSSCRVPGKRRTSSSPNYGICPSLFLLLVDPCSSGQFRYHFLQETFLCSLYSRGVRWPSGLSNTLRSPLSPLYPCTIGAYFPGGLGFPMVLAHSR